MGLGLMIGVLTDISSSQEDQETGETENEMPASQMTEHGIMSVMVKCYDVIIV